MKVPGTQCQQWPLDYTLLHGPLARYVKLRVAHAPGFPRHRRLAIQTCITARVSRTCRDTCRDRLTSGFLWSRWRGKRSRHSRRMCNPQFYVSGKRPIARTKHFTPSPTFNTIPLNFADHSWSRICCCICMYVCMHTFICALSGEVWMVYKSQGPRDS